tara:strand:+ start:142788 stop:143450 length:663 start_codon:yes stop_codon:yes gene_type:complete
MKNLKQIIVGILGCTLLISSCSVEKTKAEQTADIYVVYVDSISDLETTNAIENWSEIQKEFELTKKNATDEMEKIEDPSTLNDAIESATLKYETFKVEILSAKEKMEAINQKNRIRETLIGSNHVGDDMSFTWINKDNILSVYENFVNTAQKNKDSYSREDWDEIKLLYEAIDTRKNTVENEGLTGSDNRKIAALKLKFAPMYTFNRMGAKSEENAAAKQ